MSLQKLLAKRSERMDFLHDLNRKLAIDVARKSTWVGGEEVGGWGEGWLGGGVGKWGEGWVI